MTPSRAYGKLRPEAWLLEESKAVRSELAATIGWAVAAGLMIVLQARLLAMACHRIVMEQANLSSILPLAVAVAMVALIRGGLLLVSERSAVAAAAKVKQRVRTLLYGKLLESKPAGRVGEETGALVEAVTAGVEGLEPYVSRFLPHLALAALLPLLALIFVIPTEWRSGLVLLFSAPFIPLFMILIGRGSEKLNQRQWSRLARMAGHLLDLVQGLPDLKIFGAAKREAEVVARISDRYRQATMAVLRVAFLSAFTLEFFATIGTAVVAVVIGFRLLNASLTLVDGLFVLLLAPEFYQPLRTLGLSYHSRMQGVAAAERIAPYLDPDADMPLAGMLPAPSSASVIVFENVSFRCNSGRGGLRPDCPVRKPDASLSTVSIYSCWNRNPGGRGWPGYPSGPFFSRAASGRTWRWAVPMQAKPESTRPWTLPQQPLLSVGLQPGSIPNWVTGGPGFPAANCAAWPWRGPSCAKPRWWCWMNRPPVWTGKTNG